MNGLYQIGVRDRSKIRPARSGPAPKGAKSETSLHWHVAGMLTKHLAAPAWFTTFPAGGGGEMRGKILKGLGLKAGVPDILIVNQVKITPAYLSRGEWLPDEPITVQFLYWLELKKLNKGVLSDAQIDCQMRLTGMGCRVANCDNLEHVKAALSEWRLPYQAMTPTEAGIRSSLRNSFANV
jgi:hypothetical protein